MSDPKTYDEIKEEIDLRIDAARMHVEDNNRIALNSYGAGRDADEVKLLIAPTSYGAGHDAGEVYALVGLRKWLLGEEE